ncbi:hypothetical protein HanOQP8_Chr10g0377821 [Helianthus annuus]|nr:hypothetical protein HanOQP8_Chr10g0377821 [Helianthus annuus]
MKVENYLTWKDSFQSFIESQDARMWICIVDGYTNPTHDFEGRPRRTDYVFMQEDDKRMYEAEKRALAAIKMSLPDGIKHTFNKYTNSRICGMHYKGDIREMRAPLRHSWQR